MAVEEEEGAVVVAGVVESEYYEFFHRLQSSYKTQYLHLVFLF